MYGSLIFFNLLLFVCAALGGLLPMLHKWSERVLHWFLSLSAGVFLGAVFLHLIPEISHVSSSVTVWFSCLVGLLVIYILEMVVFSSEALHPHGEPSDRHIVLGYATFVGLSIHSLTDGLSLTVGLHVPDIELAILLSLAIHRTVAAFSLMSIFLLADFSRRKSLTFLLTFLLMTPVGSLVGAVLLGRISEGLLVYPMALAAGTFLYVGLCDLLPEVFHHKGDTAGKLLVLAGGILIMLAIKGV